MTSIAEADELRPTHVEVDLGAIARNLSRVRAHVDGAAVMPIIKANAYGHGLVNVARRLAVTNIYAFGVALLEEALLLRQSGVHSDILVLGGFAEQQLPAFFEQGLMITVPSAAKLLQVERAAAASAVRPRIHLKVDTGMGRLGTQYFESAAFLELAARCEHVEVAGIFSHFANSDAADLGSARMQLERFQEVCAFYDRASLPVPVRHMANSGAVLQFAESHLDLVRPGIMLFGVYPSLEVQRTLPLTPALSWKTSVAFSKELPPGHPVSYGSTWQSDVATQVLTLPVGYGDGYFRSMSGQAEVIIGGERYPQVGRICMDQTMVRAVGGADLHAGDEVILMGSSGKASITADDLAAWAGTIPYEILTNVNARVPRTYVDNEYDEPSA